VWSWARFKNERFCDELKLLNGLGELQAKFSHNLINNLHAQQQNNRAAAVAAMTQAMTGMADSTPLPHLPVHHPV